jgi:hypothetical protein
MMNFVLHVLKPFIFLFQALGIIPELATRPFKAKNVSKSNVLVTF